MHLGDKISDFTAWTTKHHLEPLYFHKWKDGKWCMFVSHSDDDNQVAQQELSDLNRLFPDFEQKNCLILSISPDTIEKHQALSDRLSLKFPLVADEEFAVSKLQGMLDSPLHDRDNLKGGMPNNISKTILVDELGKIRMIWMYPKSVPRNFENILKDLDALQNN